MTLFRAKEAVEDIKAARADKPKRLNPFQQMAADNKGLRDENTRLRTKLSKFESRITSLESFQSEQMEFNAGIRDRVGKLQRQATAANASVIGGRVCPGCQEVRADGPESFPALLRLGSGNA